MTIFDIFTMVGGLALFLFGMDVMGKGLEKRAGGKLHNILKRLSDNPLKGFILGLTVTAIIQSSSATTVMVVGFVNSGVMQLSQAVGVIMGSNVGTTVTSWLLSLTGIQGDSFIVTLLKPSSFAPVLAIIGVAMFLWNKRETKKSTGQILIGFAVLMTGMQTMSSAVAPLSSSAAFTSLFAMFENPVLGVLAGALLTAVIQSSSASVGILQALAASGGITLASSIPIILGQNIGTCVTALIASAGANKNARRAAFIHLYFNIIGTLLFLIIYTVMRYVFNPVFLSMRVTPLSIAIVHTAFNVLSTACMLPFTKQLEKLAMLTIRDGNDRIKLLDERLLNTPALAVEQSHKYALEMARVARDSIVHAISLTEHFNDKVAQGVMYAEDAGDLYEDILGSYLIKLSGKTLTEADSREVSKLLHLIGNFERLSDHAVNILESAQEMRDKNVVLPERDKAALNTLTRAVNDILALAMDAFENDDVSLAIDVEPLEQVIDDLTLAIKNLKIEGMRDGSLTIEMGFIISDLLVNYERVADHCSNIAVAVIEMDKNSFDTHEYLNSRKTAQEFMNKYREYSARYTLES